MATIGVLTYTLPPGLKLKNNRFNKIALSSISESSAVTNNTIITNNNNNINNNYNNNNTIVTKIQGIGMIGGEVLAMRKKQKLVPLLDSNAKNIQQGQPIKKIKLTQNSNATTITTSNTVGGGTLINNSNISGKKSTPLPQAVARRNARERNRVKQVNNGFAALRQHIPDEIAEAFEAAGNGRGTAKKLSKVETLRMAVEYIRNLERLLELDTIKSNNNCNNNKTDEITTPDGKPVIKTEFNCTPNDHLDDQYPESNYDTDDNISYINDNLPDITTVNGEQYIRIPGTNTYQLITTEIFENEENIQPIPSNHFTTADIVGPDGAHLGYTLTTAPIVSSEEVSSTTATIIAAPVPANHRYNSNSGGGNQPSSLSPADHLKHPHQNLLSQLQMYHPVHIKNEESMGTATGTATATGTTATTTIIYQTQLAPNSPPISEGPSGGGGGAFTSDVQLYDSINSSGTLKRKIKEEVILEAAALSEESMMEAIDWWDAHTPQSDESVIL